MIEKNTYSGVEGVLAEVVTQLATESDRLAAPKGARRRRRMLADKNHAGSKHSITPSHARWYLCVLIVIMIYLFHYTNT